MQSLPWAFGRGWAHLPAPSARGIANVIIPEISSEPLASIQQGQRFLASSGHSLPLIEVARTLKTHLAAEAEKVSLQPMSDAMVRAAAAQNPLMTGMVKLLGVDMNVSAAKAGWLLNWHPRSPQEAILATARSLIALGLVANH